MNHFRQRQLIAQGLMQMPEKRAKEKKQPAEKLIQHNELLQLAQAVFNAWIRRRDEGRNCFTCCEPGTEAGHFYPAGSFSGVRFSEINVHIQCGVCNRGHDGNTEVYREAMKNWYTAEEILNLDNLAKLTKKKSWSREELNTIIKKYK